MCRWWSGCGGTILIVLVMMVRMESDTSKRLPSYICLLRRQHDAFGPSFDRSADMVLKALYQCLPRFKGTVLRISSTIKRCCWISDPFWAIIRRRASRETHLGLIRDIDKTLLGLPETTFSFTVTCGLDDSPQSPHLPRTFDPRAETRRPQTNQDGGLCRCTGEASMLAGR